MDYREYTQAAKSLADLSKDMQNRLSRFPQDYFFEKMIGYTDALFNRFAPFKAGDRVVLLSTPDITAEKSWGWLGSKHFLIKGARGTVRSVDFVDGSFTATVEFDDETWKDQNGVLHPPSRGKSGFCFSEKWLETLKP